MNPLLPFLGILKLKLLKKPIVHLSFFLPFNVLLNPMANELRKLSYLTFFTESAKLFC